MLNLCRPMPEKRRLLVTSALPYANGPIHLGHLVEYLQTDIWVRFQKSQGHRAVYVCADDTHGTAIMLRAQKEGRSELELIGEMKERHLRDFQGFGIAFDHYGSTHAPENEALCREFWQKLNEAGLVVKRDITQLYDPKLEMFLADRFVKGKCPRCGTPDQYGDNCENCGAAYSATDLIDPVSVHSGAVPELRAATHYFVQIEVLHPFLEEWTQGGTRLQPEVRNYLKGHFLSEPLRDWDVSRPAPYFGFEIPNTDGNYWYVWFDAPIGYIASTHEWCKKSGEKLEDWWRSAECEVHHFIGKDITYFHTLFWPAMLKAAEYTLPTRINVHGFLTVNGEKMSKSRGTFIKAETYLRHLDPEHLRYFYAARLGEAVDDLDLNLQEFQAKVNSDLVGKVVNLASRTVRLVSELGSSYPADGGLFEDGVRAGLEIAEAYDGRDFARAMRLIMALADRANAYVADREPWKLKKAPDSEGAVQDICTVALNLYRQIVIYLGPVLPGLVRQSGELFGEDLAEWGRASNPLLGVKLRPFEHLMQRVDPKKIEVMISETAKEHAAETNADAAKSPTPTHSDPTGSASADSGTALEKEPLGLECTIDDLAKIDLRVVRVVAAEHVPEAKKLLKLTVSLGGETQKTIFAGIKSAYEPEKLVGRLIVIVANLAPRQMKFGLSEGMVLCAGEGGSDLFVLSPDAGAVPGQRLR
jgi:methionyl-tRNA synthetase